MNKLEFEKIFNECQVSITGSDEEFQEKIMQKLKEYTNGSDKIDAMELAMFAYLESISFTSEMLFKLLPRLLDINEEIL